MEYLRKEHQKYREGREVGRSFESQFPLKAHAFRSLDYQLGGIYPNLRSVLEVGPGSGYFLSTLAKRGLNVTGVDIDEEFVEYSKEVFKERGVQGKIIKGDGMNLPFPNNYFDLSLNVGTIEHFSDEEQIRFMQEMTRVSRHFVLISTPNEKPESLYQNFKVNSKFYCQERENIPELNGLVRLVGCEPVMESGFHVIARGANCSQNFRNIYAAKGLNLPKEDYTDLDLDYLLDCEKKFTQEELRNLAFLKYTLAQKS